LNLGLRYSFVSPIKEANGLLGGFDPARGLVQQGQPGFDSIFKPDYKNFSPRAGFNWDITGKGTTVLRGGSSVIYSMYTPAQWFQSSPQSFAGGAIHLVPTGACAVAVSPGTPCPSTFGGTNTTATTSIRSILRPASAPTALHSPICSSSTRRRTLRIPTTTACRRP